MDSTHTDQPDHLADAQKPEDAPTNAIRITAIKRWGPPAEVLTDIQTWWRLLGPRIVRPAV